MYPMLDHKLNHHDDLYMIIIKKCNQFIKLIVFFEYY
jgi:hypothetical protein